MGRRVPRVHLELQEQLDLQGPRVLEAVILVLLVLQDLLVQLEQLALQVLLVPLVLWDL
jgi:hypothetical protein